MNRKSSKIISIMSYLLIVVVLVGVCGLIAYFTNGFTSDFKTFYVTVDGKDVLTNTGGYELSSDEAMAVDVKYTFDKINSDISGYSLKVSANTDKEHDFTFTVDGETHNFSEEKDLSKGFEIVQTENSFTIKPKGDLDVILANVYEGQEVSPCGENTFEDMFVLTVISYNEEAKITLKFTVPYGIKKITFDKEVIVF